jgi:hypothetical protein
LSFGLKLKRLWATHQKSKGHSVPKSKCSALRPLSFFLPLSEFSLPFDFGPKLHLRALISLFSYFLTAVSEIESEIHVFTDNGTGH